MPLKAQWISFEDYEIIEKNIGSLKQQFCLQKVKLKTKIG
jgi:hypothetical protein